MADGEVKYRISGDNSKFKKDTDDTKSYASAAFGAIKTVGVATFAAIGTAVAAVGAGIVKLGKDALDSYAEFEQLAGGVETLFAKEMVGDSFDAWYESGSAAREVLVNASEAFKTAGLSANEYLSTVTSFSASLIQSLAGDTDEAARIADQTIIDMADNVNKMGSEMEMVQNAYQGFAKQNYTMLDNLKLGYGGTQEEMKRLIRDAAALSETVDAQSLSFDNVVQAIHVVQTEMGITGATAAEAATTIEGSVNSMKAAWANLLTSFASNDQFGVAFGGEVEKLIESVITVAENVVPAVQNTLRALVPGLEEIVISLSEYFPEVLNETLIPQIAESVSGIFGALFENILPTLLSSVESIVLALAENLPTIMSDTLLESLLSSVLSLVTSLLGLAPEIITTAFDLVLILASGITDAAPSLLTSAAKLITDLCTYLTDNFDNIIETAINLVLTLVETLISPDCIGSLIDSGIELLLAVQSGILEAVPGLLNQLPGIVLGIVETLLSKVPEVISCGTELISSLVSNLPGIIANIYSVLPQIITSIIIELLSHMPEIALAGFELFLALKTMMPLIILNLIAEIPNIISSIVSTLSDGWAQMKNVGANLFDGFIDGIWSRVMNAVYAVQSAINSVISSAESVLGIASPSKVFRLIGQYVDEGLAEGIDSYNGVPVKSIRRLAGLVETGMEVNLPNIADLQSGLSFNASTDPKFVVQANLTGKMECDGMTLATIMLKNIDDASAYVLRG